ncbi:NRDE family protein [Flagellimonas sp. S3867]|uniref:NRDE family protein n=1 Tax=Flagellimonas sp. S3867 TaxID=2768063 RepID=UPI0016870B2B|nr:NRDE family protein [Flagellimonas sp. S3867]
MCTVSFISRNNSYFITSNRDEHVSRPNAFEPREEIINSVKILFPRDPKAGGTWFALNEHGVVAVLLNGAFIRHKSFGNYSKSRGVVLLEVISAENPMLFLQEMDLRNIEPFTMVLFDGMKLVELRWDGKKRYFKPLDKGEDYIWSSVTLYDDEAIERRNSLFANFIDEEEELTASAIVDFHSNNHEDYENGFIINRDTGLKTFSVTQVVLDNQDSVLQHFDLLNDKKHIIPFSSNQLIT